MEQDFLYSEIIQCVLSSSPWWICQCKDSSAENEVVLHSQMAMKTAARMTVESTRHFLVHLDMGRVIEHHPLASHAVFQAAITKIQLNKSGDGEEGLESLKRILQYHGRRWRLAGNLCSKNSVRITN
jgi:hypothetical protein